MPSNLKSDTLFLRRLREITEANLENEEFGVMELSRHVGMSHSQVHRRLKTILNQSASQFIRELRLKKANEILQNELRPVSEVAYMVGFGNPSYFIKCFHDYFGYPPGHMKTDISGTKENAPEKKSFITPVESKQPKQLFSLKLIVLIVFVVLVTTLVSLFVYDAIVRKRITVSHVSDRSIAVLPLKNLTSNAEYQYLANGIMEDISHRLSHVTNLEVKSCISVEEYTKRESSIREIAKEMNVSYVLQGSILQNGKHIRVYIQLIDAQSNKNIWSEKYEHTPADLLTLVSNVSSQIADELTFILSVGEKKLVEKSYTKQQEAYKHYLEGRYDYRKNSVAGIRASIEHYNHALAVDPLFSLAYAGLADSYFEAARHSIFSNEIGVAKSKEMALKAIALDNTLAEPHVILAGISVYFEVNPLKAETELKQALALNPGYARAYKMYSELMQTTGNAKNARQYINQAMNLSTADQNIIHQSYLYYLRQGNYSKALGESEKLYSLTNNQRNFYCRQTQVYSRKKDLKQAIASFKNLHGNNLTHQELNSLNSFANMESFLKFCISKEKNNSTPNLVLLSELYLLANDADNAIKCLYELSQGNYAYKIVQIKYDVQYKKVRDDQRFLAILNKLNMGGY